MTEPGNPDAIPEDQPPAFFPELIDDSHDLMARSEGNSFLRQIPFDDVEVRPADGATHNLDPDLIGGGGGEGKILED